MTMKVPGRRAIAGGALSLVAVLVVSGCGTTTGTTMASNRRGNTSGKYMDPTAQSDLRTVGIESSDIRAASAKMVRDMLNNPLLTRTDRAPHVIVDAKYFDVETASRINKNILIDVLRSELLNAAAGRMMFVSREATRMVVEEREAAEEGLVGPGSTPSSPALLGGDYRMQGRITDHTEYADGRTERYTVILVEMVDLKQSQLVFSNTYQFKKSNQLSPVYR